MAPNFIHDADLRTLFRYNIPGTSFDGSAAVAEWLEAWDTLTMFEAAVCGRSLVRTPTGAVG